MFDFGRYTFKAAALVALLAVVGCGDNTQRDPKLNVQVIGWGPGQTGTVGFQPQLPSFTTDGLVRVSLTQPQTGKVFETKSFSPGERKAQMPKLRFGSNMRMEFELLDGNSNLAAYGATPLFNFAEGDVVQGFRIQVDHVNDFAPVGSVVTRDGRSELTQSRMDYRAVRTIDSGRWLGRIGHATVPFDDGNKLLVVGGGDVSSLRAPATMPSFRTVHDDLMEFDPITGYFTDLSYDPQSGTPRPNGADRLLEPRAFHTVTPIGENRFLVVGGLTPGDPDPRVLGSIELIDLNAAPGTRVQQLMGPNGSAAHLNRPRAFHTATFRPADNTVVVVGGIGSEGANDALTSVEFINLSTGAVQEGANLSEGRAEHQAVLMNDNQTIWVMGGRNSSGVLASTEVIERSGSGGTVGPEASMSTPRFGFSTVRITPGGNQIVMALGGYTDLQGGVTDTFEFSSLGRGQFLSAGAWRLDEARGNPNAIELPNTHDVVVMGGRDQSQVRVTSAEVLEFQSLDANNPYMSRPTNTTSYNNRSGATANLLSNGKIVLIGGIGRFDNTDTTLDSAEYFTPADPREAAASN